MDAAPHNASSAVGRVVCVAPNASVDKTVGVDRLDPGRIHRPDILSVVPGGKAINVARAAGRLGLPVLVVTTVAGHAGAWLAEALEAEAIAVRMVPIEGETRTCLSILDRDTGRLTELYEAGPSIGLDGWVMLEAAVAAELTTAAHQGVTCTVVVSGSLPPGAPADGHSRLVRLVNDAAARSVIDAGGGALARAAAARPWLVRVNEQEAAAATGIDARDDGSVLVAARALQAMGAEMVIVSRGLAGVIAVSDVGAWRIGPPPERGAYPVGSGDSLLAGVLAGIDRGADLGGATRLGVAAATANALRPGQGAIEPEDVDRVLPLVRLERLASDGSTVEG